MGFVDYVKLACSRWKDFEGRSRRAEYWWFYLATFILQIIERIVLKAFEGVGALEALFGLAFLVVGLLLLVPGVAVSFRRLHDLDKSAWWLLLWFIPVVGWILLIVWAATPGTRGSNRFGADPLEGEAATTDPLVN